ncbi:MAG: hypothetical protein CMH47_15240 [Muricauda sp.]|nr:hypothetical protein [Allomuricauda sp.]
MVPIMGRWPNPICPVWWSYIGLIFHGFQAISASGLCAILWFLLLTVPAFNSLSRPPEIPFLTAKKHQWSQRLHKASPAWAGLFYKSSSGATGVMVQATKKGTRRL